MEHKTWNIKHGFTIIELIISIFILSLAVIGVFAAFSSVVILTSSASDKLIGAYLAQEGIEIVRNIRDTNWLNIDAGVLGATWIDGLSGESIINPVNCSGSSGGCEADYTTGTILGGGLVQYGIIGNYLNIKDGFYTYEASENTTKFKRQIMIDLIAPYVLKVTVKVSWDQKATILNDSSLAEDCGKYNCITVESNLYNWYGEQF